MNDIRRKMEELVRHLAKGAVYESLYAVAHILSRLVGVVQSTVETMDGLSSDMVDLGEASSRAVLEHERALSELENRLSNLEDDVRRIS